MIPYLSTFNYPKSGDFTRFTIGTSFAVFCLVPILATRGQVISLAKEWAFIFHRSGQIGYHTNMLME